MTENKVTRQQGDPTFDEICVSPRPGRDRSESGEKVESEESEDKGCHEMDAMRVKTVDSLRLLIISDS